MKKSWLITKESFDTLLAFLNPDRDLAADEYERIRKKLVAFFECRGCHFPEDLTDVTINRVAKRISEGVEIHTTKPSAYFFGVAYKVLQESWSDPSVKSLSLDDSSSQIRLIEKLTASGEAEAPPPAPDREMECLEQCLEQISSANRKLIIQYYQNVGGAKIRHRKQLAGQLGISGNALRIQALRIRKRLEQCVTDCLEQSSDT
ncbi:MAG TPA: hypothetical protein VJ464_23240 [Blastocatellia bacterium]|nr:hypothetical protein [Blastocatellia bacterium]